MEYWIILLMGLALVPAGWMIHRSLTQELIRDLRLPRILHYVVLACIGMALHLRHENRLDEFLHSQQIWLLPLFAVALAYAAVFAIITNNLEDTAIDRITNVHRPHVKGTVNKNAYLMAGIICQAWALGIAWLAHPAAGWGIVLVSAGYFIYSCRPFRLKKIPIVSKLLIGMNSLFVAVAGYALAGGEWKMFPVEWAVFLALPLALAANFVDLKDTEGDRADGIATLPVLLGEKNARMLIAFFTVAAYVMGGILLNIIWVYPLNVLVLALHLYFLFRKPYDEKWVFAVYVTSLGGIAVFLFFS